MADPQEIIKQLREDLARDKREEDGLAALCQIAEAHQEAGKVIGEVGSEVVSILRAARIWGPILIAALLGSDVLGDIVRARLDTTIGRSGIVEPITETPVSAATKEP